MGAIDLTGYTYVGSYDGSTAALTANTTYIVMPNNGRIEVRNSTSSNSYSIVEVYGYSMTSSPYLKYPAKAVKFKTPSSPAWYVWRGNVFKKS